MARLFFGDKEIHGLSSYSLTGGGTDIKGFFDKFKLTPPVKECKEGEIYICTEINTGRIVNARCVGSTEQGYVDMVFIEEVVGCRKFGE
jgi:hypothetical protein